MVIKLAKFKIKTTKVSFNQVKITSTNLLFHLTLAVIIRQNFASTSSKVIALICKNVLLLMVKMNLKRNSILCKDHSSNNNRSLNHPNSNLSKVTVGISNSIRTSSSNILNSKCWHLFLSPNTSHRNITNNNGKCHKWVVWVHLSHKVLLTQCPKFKVLKLVCNRCLTNLNVDCN